MAGPEGVEITGPVNERFDEILTPEALGFSPPSSVSSAPGAGSCSAKRGERQAELASGGTLDFLPETAPTSGTTTPGAWPTRPRAWTTAASRSRGRPTAR